MASIKIALLKTELFRRDMDKDEAAIKNSKRYQEASKEYTAVGCYITTVVVNILGMEDDCDLLMTLRKFRKEVLHPNPLYKDILLKYDALGPALAKAIAASKNCLSLAEDLYNIYLKGCAKYIKAGQTEKAIALYSKMTNCLISTFIDIQAIGEEVIENYDQENGGRGAIRLKK